VEGATCGTHQIVVTITYRKRPLVSARIQTHIVYTHPTKYIHQTETHFKTHAISLISRYAQTSQMGSQ
jgi:hypothetical protein